MLLFSVVIPVYKVEEYLDHCVESVVKQSYRNIEVILVDDGSPDCCGLMCDEWAKKDERVRVIHQQNCGLSAARNTGIANATGDYIVFLDSDDWWENSDALMNIAEILEKTPVDVLNFNYRKSFDDRLGATYFNECIPSTEKAEDISYLLDRDLLVCSSWNKVVRLSLVKQNQLYFREGITSEDIDWTLRLVMHAQTFFYSNQCVLVYRQRSKSITHSISMKSVCVLRDNISCCIDLLETVSKETRDQLNAYVAYQYATLVYNVACLPQKERGKLYPDVKRMKYLLATSNNPKVRKIYQSERYFGMSVTMYLLRMKHKLGRIGG